MERRGKSSPAHWRLCANVNPIRSNTVCRMPQGSICPIFFCGWHIGSPMERCGNAASQIDDLDDESQTEPGLLLDSRIFRVANATLFGEKMVSFGFDNIPTILAPMAGVTDHAFRLVCAERGACMCVTEMISAKAVQFNDKKTYELARIGEDECPCALQLFGSEPDIIADSAKRLIERARAGDGSVPVMLDINMGCPVKKVAGNGEGSALMKRPTLAGEIVRKTADNIDIPVSVKIRAGWDTNSKNAVEVAQIAEQSGASLVTVHGRTRSQMYTPGVDYEMIARVKKSLSIPIIANGDIYSGEDALRVLDITGCDGLMIGRGALGNPFIFEEIKSALEGKFYERPSAEEVISCAKKHLELLTMEKGEMGVLEFRKHAAWYTKGMRGASAVRSKMNSAITVEHMYELFDSLI